MADAVEHYEASRDDGPEDLVTTLRRRCVQIGERIEQLQERRRQLEDRLTPGTSVEESTEAQLHAELAHAHAEQAHERMAERRAQAAALHDQVADVLAQHGRFDRARAHREAAEHDRDAAGDAQEASPDL
jgi:DNA repair exonuclease SbcCD ATPase subunit